MTWKQPEDTAILIVDDEAGLCNTFRIILERQGYGEVQTAGSFEGAVQAVSETVFDLVICDIVLESRSGIELLERLRQLGIQCPVVIITGHPHVESASDALRLGAFDYLPKPVEKEVLLRTTRLAIEHYHLAMKKKEAEAERESYRRFLETIFRSVSDAIISVDLELKIMEMNSAAKEFFLESGQSYGSGAQTLDQLCKSSHLVQLPAKVLEVLESYREISDHRIEYCTADQEFRTLSICISGLDGGKGKVDGCVLVFRDMSRKDPCREHHRSRFHRMVGASLAMQKIYMMIENIGKVDTSVLITGPSGTGKELVAEALHRESRRCNGPLVKVNCTAIPDNLMESELFGHKKGAFTGAGENRAGRILQADGGTLFLDEIGDISMNMQLRLLRFLQERTFYPVGSDREVRVDVRVIAATNAHLRQKVADKSFREDLYYRLLIIDINLPPLSARDGDISLLANYFIDHFAGRLKKSITGISGQAIALLNRYNWPGNVRQLEHVMERACVLCNRATITSEHLPDEILSEPLAVEDGVQKTAGDTACNRVNRVIKHTLTEDERQTTEAIIAALTKTGGNKAKAARRLNIDRSTLYRKIKELHIDVEMFTE